MRGSAAVYRGRAAAATVSTSQGAGAGPAARRGAAHLLGLCQMQGGRPPAAGIWMPVVASMFSWSYMNACAHARARCIIVTMCVVDEGAPACSTLAHAVSYHPWHMCGDVHFANRGVFMVWSLLCSRQPTLTWVGWQAGSHQGQEAFNSIPTTHWRKLVQSAEALLTRPLMVAALPRCKLHSLLGCEGAGLPWTRSAHDRESLV